MNFKNKIFLGWNWDFLRRFEPEPKKSHSYKKKSVHNLEYCTTINYILLYWFSIINTFVICNIVINWSLILCTTYCTVLYSTQLYCTQITALNSTVLYSTALCSTVLFNIVLQYSLLCYTVLYFTVLHCNILYSILQ